MLSRRTYLVSVPVMALVAGRSIRGSGAMASATGSGEPQPVRSVPPGPGSGLLSVPVERAPAEDGEAARQVAGAVRAFSADLFRVLCGAFDGNVACSPYSVALALGMTRAGAGGITAREMDAVLHVPDRGRWDAGLNTLERTIASRSRDVTVGEKSVPVVLQGANSLWGQQDLTWREEFLTTLTRYYGATMQTVDYVRAAEQARLDINAWVGDRTHQRIPELLPPQALTPLTRLTLVNALYLNAPWHTPFEEETSTAPFTLPDGGEVLVPQMTSHVLRVGYASGDGWQAVDLPYAGGELAMAVVLPDPDRLADVVAACDGAWLEALLTGFTPESLRMRMPPWTFRVARELREDLAGLGMQSAFTGNADFSGMTEDADLSVDRVFHETFIAVDQRGTEAAAATAVVMVENVPASPRELVADRPFLFVVHDVATATPLFVGRVTDPRHS